MAKSNLPGFGSSDNFIERMLAKKTAEAGELALRGASQVAVTASGSELEAVVRRVMEGRPGQELQLGLLELANARALAAATWAAARASAGNAPGSQSAAEMYARRGGADAARPMDLTTNTGGLQVLFDWERRLPHTYHTAKGAHCLTDTWISDGFLVFDPRLEPPALGSVDNPWFGIRGPGFRCYYPGSSVADWESCMTSGSSGRWLARWSQKKSYTTF